MSVTTQADLPRGLRNHNPGNLERTDPRAGWEGALADDDLTDPRFEQFTNDLYGLRALARVLINYQAADHCQTLRQIINRWAPRTENNTDAYVSSVCSYASALRRTTIWPSDPYPLLFAVGTVDPAAHRMAVDGNLAALIQAIVHHENGLMPFSPILIQSAIDLARRA